MGAALAVTIVLASACSGERASRTSRGAPEQPRSPRRGSCSSRMTGERHRGRAGPQPTAPTGRLRCHDLAGGNQTNPDWSPDGQRFVFAMNDGERDDLWVADADGSDARMLLDCRGSCRWLDDPDWSPDGKQIVYSRTIQRADGWGIGTLETVDVATGRYASCSVRGSGASRPARGTRPTAPGRLREGAQDRARPERRHRRGHPRRRTPRPSGSLRPRAHRPAAVRRHGRLEPGREAHRVLRARRAGRRSAGPVLDPPQGRRNRLGSPLVSDRRRATPRTRPGCRTAAVCCSAAGSKESGSPKLLTVGIDGSGLGSAFGDDVLFGTHPRAQPVP